MEYDSEITELSQVHKVSVQLKQNLSPDHFLSKVGMTSNRASNRYSNEAMFFIIGEHYLSTKL